MDILKFEEVFSSQGLDKVVLITIVLIELYILDALLNNDFKSNCLVLVYFWQSTRQIFIDKDIALEWKKNCINVKEGNFLIQCASERTMKIKMSLS